MRRRLTIDIEVSKPWENSSLYGPGVLLITVEKLLSALPGLKTLHTKNAPLNEQEMGEEIV